MQNMLEGIIVKGIGGFYYVDTCNGVVECKARGKFKKEGISPMVGDRVRISLQDQGYGAIEEIFPRKSCLIRPTVANVDQAIIVQAITEPEPNIPLLDRFILFAEVQELDIIICFNKADLQSCEVLERLVNVYSEIGYKVIATSVNENIGIDELREVLKGKVSVFAGPSGVGKSSLLNSIDKHLNLQTGEISKKIERGKHTTRHAELLKLENGGLVVDTPGFSSLDILPVEEIEQLETLFKEFQRFSGNCKFHGCKHYKEPDCGVKHAIEAGDISKSRHDSYIMFLEQLKNRRKYK